MGAFPVFLGADAEYIQDGFCEIAGGLIAQLVANFRNGDIGGGEQVGGVEHFGVLGELVNAFAHIGFEQAAQGAFADVASRLRFASGWRVI